jgi:hypothetical protein
VSGRSPVRVLVGIGLALVLAASACGGGSHHARKPSTTATKAPPTAPLTGLPDPSGVSQTRAALNVKIENLPAARPQSGLDLADVVYEEVVDGGITRFVAIFQSTSVDPIGPIRSVRLVDPPIVWPLGGLFVYSGGLAEEVARVRAAPVLTLDEGEAGDAVFRDHSRDAPHNLYGHTDAMWARGGKPIPPPPLFTYLAQGKAFTGDPVTSLTVGFDQIYGQPTYTWDPVAKVWKRSYGAGPHVMADGQQIAPANVIAQFIGYNGGPGASGAEGIVVGQGDAWVFSDGQVVKGRWVRPDQAAPAQYVDAAGKPIKLTPGRTWVELVPVGYGVSVVSPPPPPASVATTTTKPKKKKS